MSEPKPTKMDLYKQSVDEWLEETPYSALRILEKLRKMDLNEKAAVRFETIAWGTGTDGLGFLRGSPGVLGRDLASALGLVAAQHRVPTCYVNCYQLIGQLTKAHFENRLPG